MPKRKAIVRIKIKNRIISGVFISVAIIMVIVGLSFSIPLLSNKLPASICIPGFGCWSFELPVHCLFGRNPNFLWGGMLESVWGLNTTDSRCQKNYFEDYGYHYNPAIENCSLPIHTAWCGKTDEAKYYDWLGYCVLASVPYNNPPCSCRDGTMAMSGTLSSIVSGREGFIRTIGQKTYDSSFPAQFPLITEEEIKLFQGVMSGCFCGRGRGTLPQPGWKKDLTQDPSQAQIVSSVVLTSSGGSAGFVRNTVRGQYYFINKAETLFAPMGGNIDPKYLSYSGECTPLPAGCQITDSYTTAGHTTPASAHYFGAALDISCGEPAVASGNCTGKTLEVLNKVMKYNNGFNILRECNQTEKSCWSIGGTTQIIHIDLKTTRDGSPTDGRPCLFTDCNARNPETDCGPANTP